MTAKWISHWYALTNPGSVHQLSEAEWPNISKSHLQLNRSYRLTGERKHDLVNMTSAPVKLSESATNLTVNTAVLNEPNYWAFSLLVFPFITIFGNILVVLSVIRDQSLHTATNYFIVSLAAADIALAVVVMPICSWIEVTNRHWYHSAVFCDLFIMFDVMLCTASILNLAAISIDRYVAVTSPIVYSRHNNMLRVGVTIATTWIVSFVIALPIACGLNDTVERNPNECVMNSAGYIIGSSIGSFYIPGGIMIILYLKVFSVIRSRGRRNQHYNGDTSIYCNLNKIDKSNTLKDESRQLKLGDCATNCSSDTGFGERDNHEGVSTSMDMVGNDEEFGVRFVLNVMGENQSLVNETVNLPNHSDGTYEIDCQINPRAHVDSITDKSLPANRSNPVDANSFCGNNREDYTHNVSAHSEDNNYPNFKDMEEFRKHLRNRIRQARERKVAIKPYHYVGMSGKQVYALSPVGNVQQTTTTDWMHQDCQATPITSRLWKRLWSRKENPAKQKKLPSRSMSSPGRDNHVSRLLLTPAYMKERLPARRERKATKTLAIVLGVFLVCWMPFFTVNIILAICVQRRASSSPCQLYEPFLIVAVWLGYVNSTLNPIIYTIFNNDFRKAFKKLLCCSRIP